MKCKEVIECKYSLKELEKIFGQGKIRDIDLTYRKRDIFPVNVSGLSIEFVRKIRR